MSIFNVPLDIVRCVFFPMLTYEELGVLSGVCSDWRHFILNKHAKQLCKDIGAEELCVGEAQINRLQLLNIWQRGQSALSCGNTHAAMLARNGSVLMWQEHAVRSQIVLPPATLNTTRAVSVSCGDNHTVILMSDGTVYAFGKNDHGQLGLGDKQDRAKPFPIVGDNAYMSAKAGENYTVLLTKRNTLAWTGSLSITADSNAHEVVVPTDIPFALREPSEKITQIAAGARHILVLTNFDRLLSAGSSVMQQLGRPVSEEKCAHELQPVFFTDRPKGAKIVQVSAGIAHSLVLLANGSVFAFGKSSSGELGLPSFRDASTAQMIPNLPQAIAVSAGSHHSLILGAAKNKIVAFGMGALGQLGYRASFWSSTYPRDSPLPPNEGQRINFIAAGNGFSACLSGDGEELYACGRSSLCAGAGSGVVAGTVLPVFSRVPAIA